MGTARWKRTKTANQTRSNPSPYRNHKTMGLTEQPTKQQLTVVDKNDLVKVLEALEDVERANPYLVDDIIAYIKVKMLHQRPTEQ